MSSPLARSSSPESLASAPNLQTSDLSPRSNRYPSPPPRSAASLEAHFAYPLEPSNNHDLGARCCICLAKVDFPATKCPICGHHEPCEICLDARHLPDAPLERWDPEDLLASPDINGRAMSSSSGSISLDILMDCHSPLKYRNKGRGLVGVAGLHGRRPGCEKFPCDDGPIQDWVCCLCGKPFNGDPCDNCGHYCCCGCPPLYQ